MKAHLGEFSSIMEKKQKDPENTYPIVVIKLVVKDPSEKRKRRQLLPTPVKPHKQNVIRKKLDSVSKLLKHTERTKKKNATHLMSDDQYK